MPHSWLLPVLVLTAAVWAVACGNGDDTPGQTPTAAATPTPPKYKVGLQEAPCGFELPRGQENSDVRCGYVEVPENRAGAQSRRIRLAFATLRTSAAEPGTPLLFLDGGPGGSTLRGILGWFAREFAEPLQSQRDLVFFDYRGTGLSEPNMSCPELDSLVPTTPGDEGSREAQEDEAESALLACRDRIVGAGADLDAYHTAEVAADASDLMGALGYERFSVYGASYGTRVALTMLRDRPVGIERAVLDSAYPPDVDLYAELAVNQQRGLERVMAACREQAACGAAFPDLERKLFEVIEKLNAQPVELEARDPGTGALRPIVVDGTVLLSLLFGSLSSDGLLVRIPEVIDAAAKGQYQALTPALDAQYGGIGGPSGAVPMRTSVLCAEEVPFTSAEAVQTASEELWPAVRAAGLFGIGDAAELQEELDFCTRWGVATQPAREAEAVRSDAPALILAGAFDGSTPPRWARMAAASLSNSTLVEFTGMGHGVLFRPDAQCAMQIVVAFLEDPATVEASCAEAEPDFALPPGSGG